VDNALTALTYNLKQSRIVGSRAPYKITRIRLQDAVGNQSGRHVLKGP